MGDLHYDLLRQRLSLRSRYDEGLLRVLFKTEVKALSSPINMAPPKRSRSPNLYLGSDNIDFSTSPSKKSSPRKVVPFEDIPSSPLFINQQPPSPPPRGFPQPESPGSERSVIIIASDILSSPHGLSYYHISTTPAWSNGYLTQESLKLVEEKGPLTETIIDCGLYEIFQKVQHRSLMLMSFEMVSSFEIFQKSNHHLFEDTGSWGQVSNWSGTSEYTERRVQELKVLYSELDNPETIVVISNTGSFHWRVLAIRSFAVTIIDSLSNKASALTKDEHTIISWAVYIRNRLFDENKISGPFKVRGIGGPQQQDGWSCGYIALASVSAMVENWDNGWRWRLFSSTKARFTEDDFKQYYGEDIGEMSTINLHQQKWLIDIIKRALFT